ncbi:MAG TPA: hypothetical protein VGL94_14400, partial [Ktedonobacteraceae bacterium]
MIKIFKSPTKVVWTYGAITGVCVAILSIVPQILERNDVPGSITMGNLVIVLTMVAFLLAGMLSSKQAGRVRTGSLAGLVAGLTSGIILSVVTLLQGARPDLNALFVFMLGIGAVMGMLGGLIGNMEQWMNAPNSSAKIVWTYGTISGICLGICLGTLAIAPLEYTPVVHIRALLIIILPIVAFLLAGMFASKQTGRVRAGSLAGLVAGLTAGIIAWAGTWAWGLLAGQIDMGPPGLMTVVNQLPLEAISLVFLLGVGTGIATLGGLIGTMMKAKVPPAGDPI